MTIEELSFEYIQKLVEKDEHRFLELKKTTGELKDGMHSACAFLNTDGGWLLFGVAPKSLKILGQQVTDDTQRELAEALSGFYPEVNVDIRYVDVPGRNGDQVIAMHFDGWERGMMPYTFHGKPYWKKESTTREMPHEEYEDRLRAAKPEKFAWERIETADVDLADLDEKRIRDAVRLGVERGRMPATAEAESVEAIISKWGMMRNGKVLNGAVALFGKRLTGYTQMSMRLARFRGTDKNEFVDSGRAEGNYFDLLDAGMAFLFKHLSQSGKIVGFQKEEQLEIPAEALREALTNALCHRQLEKYNLTPGIAVYDDRVEIENPGRLPLGITPDNVMSAHASQPYNPIMAEVLFKASFLESWGSGVGRMVDACRAQGIPEPKYEEFGGFVKIIFRKRIAVSGLSQDTSKDTSKDTSRVQVREQVLRLIQILTFEMSVREMMEKLELKNRSKFVLNYLNPALEAGVLAMTQPDSPKSPTQKYYLTDVGKSLIESRSISPQIVQVSKERIERLIGEFDEALPRFEIGLPQINEQCKPTLPVEDVRCFQAAYKMKKEMFEDSGSWIYETPELYLHEIQVNIWQHYNVQFLMHHPDASYKIRFSEIKKAFEALGVDGRYVVITSFYLGTFDALYGGDVALKETDYGYQYGDVPIYKVPSHEAHLIVMRKEFLPRYEAKVYEGPDKAYKLINKEHLLYSNLFNMKEEADGLGLVMMRDLKFYLPSDDNFHYVKLMVDRMERVESELGKIVEI